MESENFFLISRLGHESTLWILLVLSVVSVAVALERFFYLKSWQKSLKKGCQEMKKLHHVEGWIRVFNTLTLPRNLNLKLVSQYLEEEPHLAEDVMKNFILSKKTLLESKLSVLSTVGSNAPFVGLLGTIFGVMEAFYSLGISSESAAPIVMQGISKALLATAVGLIVAIPAIVFYNFLRRKVQKILNDFEYIQSIIRICAQSSKVSQEKNLKEKSSKKDSSQTEKSSFGEKPLNETKTKVSF